MVDFDLFFQRGRLFTQPRDWLGLFGLPVCVAVEAQNLAYVASSGRGETALLGGKRNVAKNIFEWQ